MHIPNRNPEAKKGDAGKVLVVGGSPFIHGAPILAALGALSAGTDLVRLFLPKKHAVVARTKHTNFMVWEFAEDQFSLEDARTAIAIAEEWATTVVLGCGFFRDELPAIEHFLERYSGSVVIDAGALQTEILALVRGRKNILLTPHAGEFRRLFGIIADKYAVKNEAERWGVTILRKGMRDVIANDTRFEEIHAGCPEMAIGGTGDALAGICGGLMAHGLLPYDAAKMAAWYWGKAGEELAKRKRVFSAEDLLLFFQECPFHDFSTTG